MMLFFFVQRFWSRQYVEMVSMEILVLMTLLSRMENVEVSSVELMDEWINEWISGWVNEWMNEWMNELVSEWMNKLKNEWMWKLVINS